MSYQVQCDECWDDDADTLMGVGWDTEYDTPIVRLLCSDCADVIEEVKEVTQQIIMNMTSS